MIEQSADIVELALALHKAQATVDGVKKDSRNPHFKNNYASLEAVIDTAKPALQANGIAFTQAPGALVDGAIEITTMLLHVSGQWVRSTLHVPLGKRDAQGVGSAITYGCRYSLMAMLGLPPVDDDGEEASKPVPRAEPKRPPQNASQWLDPDQRALPGRFQALYDELEAAITNAETMDALGATMKAHDADLQTLPEEMKAGLRRTYSFKAQALRTFGEAA